MKMMNNINTVVIATIVYVPSGIVFGSLISVESVRQVAISGYIDE